MFLLKNYRLNLLRTAPCMVIVNFDLPSFPNNKRAHIAVWRCYEMFSICFGFEHSLWLNYRPISWTHKEDAANNLTTKPDEFQ